MDGVLIGRANRFAADVSVTGERARAHLPNSGRMRELLVPGAPVRLRPEPGFARRTPYDLVQVFAFGRWVCLDTRTPPAVAIAAQRAGLLVQQGVALFPDAPTDRGARHLRELAAAVAPGVRAAVVFVVQRDDAVALAPFTEADLEFAAALGHAAGAGVEPYAITCRVDEGGLHPLRAIPVRAGTPA